MGRLLPAFFGNFILGVFEAWMIRRTSTTVGKSPALMIAANFASMIVGIGLVVVAGPLQNAAARDPLRLSLAIIVGLWLVAFVLTVFVEWWFVARTAGLTMSKQSLLLSFRVQSVSYICLVPIVMLIGSVTAVTGLSSASAAEIRTVPGWVYYHSLDKRTVMRTRLSGDGTESVIALPSDSVSSTGRVTIEPTSDNDHARLLFRDNLEHIELDKNIGTPRQCAPVERRGADKLAWIGNDTFGIGSTRSFVKPPSVQAGFWAREGITIGGHRFALETPYLWFAWRSPIVLPDGKVVAQFGEAIVLIDPKTRRCAKLAQGNCGDVLLD